MKETLFNRLPLGGIDQPKQHNIQEREFEILVSLTLPAITPRRASPEYRPPCAVANLARMLAKRKHCCRDDFKVGGPRRSLAFGFVLFYWLAYLCHTVTLDWPACCLPDVEKVLKFTRILPLPSAPRAQHSHTFEGGACSQ